MIVQEYEIDLNPKSGRMPSPGDAVVIGNFVKGVLVTVIGTASGLRGRFLLFESQDVDVRVFRDSRPRVVREIVPDLEVRSTVDRLRRQNADLDAILRNVAQAVLALPSN